MAMLRRLFTIGGWTLASRILGLVRDRMLGAAFGASLGLSAFMAAFQLSNLLRNLFGEGALSAAFVPRYVRLRQGEPALAEGFAGLVIARLAFGLGLLAGVGMAVCAVLCIMLDVNHPLWLIAWLGLPQLPYLVFICVSAIMAGTINGRRRFAIPAASPIVLNLMLIAVVLIGGPRLILLPYAVLVTGLLQVGLHLVGLMVSGGVPRPDRAASRRVAELRRALLPTIIASGVYQLNSLLDTWIAYFFLRGTVDGAVTFLYFGNRLLQFPMSLVTHAVGTAAYPDLAAGAMQGWPATGERLRRSLEILIAVLLPAAIGLFLVAGPLVRVVYQTGAFDAAAAQRTEAVLRCYVLGLVPVGCARLLVQACHAHLDQRTPMVVGIGMVLLNLILNLLLVTTPMQEAGLALSTAVSGAVNCAVLLAVITCRGGGQALRAFLCPVPLIASVVMGATVWYLLRRWSLATEASTMAHALRLAAVVLTGMATYAILGGRHLRRALRRAG
jgi:putative peptidoglycan lipid II flippase